MRYCPRGAWRVRVARFEPDLDPIWTRSGIWNLECAGGYIFCSEHRQATAHECDFDHQTHGKVCPALKVCSPIIPFCLMFGLILISVFYFWFPHFAAVYWFHAPFVRWNSLTYVARWHANSARRQRDLGALGFLHPG
jgi:hypothetical protein